MHAQPRLLAALGLIAVIAAACSSTASPAPSGPAISPEPSPVVAGPSPSSPVVVEPSGAPVATPIPSGVPSPVPSRGPVAWSKAVKVPGLDNCGGVSLAIDGSGTSHLVATCEAARQLEVRYAASTDNVHWKALTFPRPARTAEEDAGLAIDGSAVYLGTTRQVLTDGGCGDDGFVDAGVYVRTLAVPSGTWSKPVRIGGATDALQSFRVADGVIHATVTSDDGAKTWYERFAAGATTPAQRTAIGDAGGPVALRIGDGGTARVAYEGPDGIRFGTVDATVSTSPIPNSTNGFDPIFVLEPGNVADVLWNRGDHGAGCAGAGPQPEDGTYFATNAGGTWKTTHLSKAIGASSLTTDPTTGDLIAVIRIGGNPVVFRSADRSSWTHATLEGGDTWSGTLRVNPVSGQQVLVTLGADTELSPSEVSVRTNG